MIDIRNVSVRYPGDRRTDQGWVLKDIHLRIERGQSMALVGESGSGKTTLARALAGTVNPEKGTITWKGQPVKRNRKGAGSNDRLMVGYVFQDYIQSLDPRQTIGQIFDESLRLNFGEKVKDLNAFVESLGLTKEVLLKRPHQLSGGMCQRVAVGRAVLLNPDLLILDESTNALDYARQVEIVDLVKVFQKIHGFSTLWITHDLLVAAYACNAFAFMKEGRIVSVVSGVHALANIQDPYGKRLVDLAGYLGGAWNTAQE